VSYALADQHAGTPLKIVVSDYPPYEFAEPVDGLKGFDVEVLEAAFDRVQVNITIEFMPWKRAKYMTARGEVPAAFSCARDAEREKVFYFSDIISGLTHGLFVRKDFDIDASLIHRIEDVKELEIIATLGYVNDVELTEKAIPHQTAQTDLSALKMVVLERAETFYTQKEVSNYLIRSSELSASLKFIELRKADFYVCFSKKWPNVEELISKFNKGLALIRADGTYDAIHAKYR